MATATKLPSGNWRARGYNRHLKEYKSFTRQTKREAERAAAEFGLYIPSEEELEGAVSKSDNPSVTLKEAALEYTNSRSNSLSPSTAKKYKTMIKSSLAGMAGMQVQKITANLIQKHINDYAANHSEKSCRDMLGFIKSVCKSCGRKTDWTIRLPEKRNEELIIPENDELRHIIGMIDDLEMMIIVRIAAELGARRSEICALTWVDVSDGVLRINKTYVQGPDGEWTIKDSPKSKAGFRKLKIPSGLYSLLMEWKEKRKPRENDRIFTILPDALSARWKRLKEKAGVNFRFHDLRHFNASVMMEIGIPDKYSMARLGHSTPDMTRRVYQHVRSKKNAEIDQAIAEKMESIF